MVVGLFGDSCAADFWEIGWPALLSRKYGLTVKNYAHPCTSAYWAYTELLKHIAEVDQVVFVLTSMGRLYTPNLDHYYIGTLATTELKLQSPNINNYEKELCEAAKRYYTYLSNNNFDWFVEGQIVKEIKNLTNQYNKPLLLIPAFPGGVPYQTVFTTSLVEIMHKELTLNFGSDQYISEKQTRANHMSAENNVILADKIHGLLRTTCTNVSLDDFYFTKYPDPSGYWNC